MKNLFLFMEKHIMHTKNRIEKIYQDYSSVSENIENKWSKDFFYSLFLEKNIFFISFNNPLEGYLIGRKIIDEYEILSLATDIKKRRRGVGLGLMHKLLDMAKKEKIKRVILEVSKNNIAAINMYKKLGFKKVSIRKKYYRIGVSFLDAYLMEKYLN